MKRRLIALTVAISPLTLASLTAAQQPGAAPPTAPEASPTTVPGATPPTPPIPPVNVGPEPYAAPSPEPNVAPAVVPQPVPSAAPAAPASSPVVVAPAAPAVQLEPAKPETVISGAPGKGLSIKVGDAFSFNLRARFQLRYQLDIPPEDDAGERNYQQLINIGTARLWFSGNVFRPEVTYMLQLAVAGRDYRDGAISPIFDAFIDWKADRDFNIRAGQFFVPFDRLRTVREFALQMPDRPVPIGELTLDRDAGVLFYSDRFLGSPFAWRAGVFGGGGTNLTAGKEPGLLLTARLEARPLGPIDDDSEGDLERREVPGLAIGAGIARNWNTNRQRSTTGVTFAGGTTDYLHLAADAVFKWRGFAAQLEYLYKKTANDTILSLGANDALVTEWTRSGGGWVAQASYTFDPPFEIVGRYSKLNAFAGTDPRLVDTDEVGVGLNYYLNGHQFKLQGAWIAKVPTERDFEDAAHLAVVQLDATF